MYNNTFHNTLNYIVKYMQLQHDLGQTAVYHKLNKQYKLAKSAMGRI